MYCYLYARIPTDKQPHDSYYVTTGMTAVRKLHERAPNFFGFFLRTLKMMDAVAAILVWETEMNLGGGTVAQCSLRACHLLKNKPNLKRAQI